MNWIVTYRDSTGALTQASFEAADRSSLFKVLAAKGISAVRIEQSSARLRPQKSSSKKNSPSPQIRNGLLAAAFVVAGGCAVLWWFRDTSTREVPKHSATKEKVERGNSPAPRQTSPSQSTEGVVQTPVRGAAISNSTFVAEAAAEAARIQKWKERFAKHRTIFSNSSDQILSMIAGARPGQPMPPLPITKSIDRDFEKSLETEIIFDKDDSDEIRAAKEAVLRMRTEIRAIKEVEGLSVYEILTQHLDLVNENAATRIEAQKEAIEIYNGGDEEGARQYVEAVNEKLQALGSEPIKMPGEQNPELRQHIRERLEKMKQRNETRRNDK